MINVDENSVHAENCKCGSCKQSTLAFTHQDVTALRSIALSIELENMDAYADQLRAIADKIEVEVLKQ